MSIHTLANEEFEIKINSMGAELVSILDRKDKTQYLWNGDPAYWGRISPILFPVVGGLKNKEYRYGGAVYPMAQHGFARDMEFTLTEKTDHYLCLRLSSTEETRKLYPFDFALELGYRLEKNQVTVEWKVLNTDSKMLYFSIGGHPGFMCPLRGKGVQTDYFLGFDTTEDIEVSKISGNGLAVKDKKTLKNEDGTVQITAGMFDEDALVIENHQAHAVSLMDNNRKAYITVNFHAPLFGIWSPAGKNAPFICIEPWYGRCDSEDFAGSLEDREWGESLEPGHSFFKHYEITINK